MRTEADQLCALLNFVCEKLHLLKSEVPEGSRYREPVVQAYLTANKARDLARRVQRPS